MIAFFSDFCKIIVISSALKFQRLTIKPVVLFLHFVHPAVQILHECILVAFARLECADAVREAELDRKSVV